MNTSRVSYSYDFWIRAPPFAYVCGFGCCIQNVQSFGNVKRANVEVAERTVHDLVSENMALKAVQRVVFYIKPLKQRVAL